jgi:hypothetical protein
MTTLTHRNCRKSITLTGNRMTGDTYPIKSIIKNNFDGIWDAQTSSWIVNVEKVEKAIGVYLFVVTETAPVVTTSTYKSTICPRCHTYCDSDCQS